MSEKHPWVYKRVAMGTHPNTHPGIRPSIHSDTPNCLDSSNPNNICPDCPNCPDYPDTRPGCPSCPGTRPSCPDTCPNRPSICSHIGQDEGHEQSIPNTEDSMTTAFCVETAIIVVSENTDGYVLDLKTRGKSGQVTGDALWVVVSHEEARQLCEEWGVEEPYQLAGISCLIHTHAKTGIALWKRAFNDGWRSPIGGQKIEMPEIDTETPCGPAYLRAKSDWLRSVNAHNQVPPPYSKYEEIEELLRDTRSKLASCKSTLSHYRNLAVDQRLTLRAADAMRRVLFGAISERVIEIPRLKSYKCVECRQWGKSRSFRHKDDCSLVIVYKALDAYIKAGGK